MEIFHKGLPRTFLGVPNNYGKARYVVLCAPYDATVSYMPGTRSGPAAILEASRQVETYDIELGRDFEDAGIFTEDELECDRGSPERNCKFVEEAVEAVLEEGKVPVLLGGEHSVSVGALDAISGAKDSANVSVLHIDAHADMREEYEGTKFNHACVMKRCREKLHAVSVGVRSYSKEEADEMRKRKLDVYGIEFDADEVVKKLKGEVYITIDLDAFDPSEVPGVGTPEPGGLRWGEVVSLLRKVCEKKKVIGFDVVELCPVAGRVQSDFLAARLVYKLICCIEANRK